MIPIWCVCLYGVVLQTSAWENHTVCTFQSAYNVLPLGVRLISIHITYTPIRNMIVMDLLVWTVQLRGYLAHI